MNSATSERESDAETTLLIDHLRRQMAAAGNDDVPASVYQAHHEHWSANHTTRPFVQAGDPYEDYAPAYLYGVFFYYANPDRSFDSAEDDLAKGWDSARGDSPIDWSTARPAVREAWYRVGDLAERAKQERTELLSTSSQPRTPGDH